MEFKKYLQITFLLAASLLTIANSVYIPPRPNTTQVISMDTGSNTIEISVDPRIYHDKNFEIFLPEANYDHLKLSGEVTGYLSQTILALSKKDSRLNGSPPRIELIDSPLFTIESYMIKEGPVDDNLRAQFAQNGHFLEEGMELRAYEGLEWFVIDREKRVRYSIDFSDKEVYLFRKFGKPGSIYTIEVETQDGRKGKMTFQFTGEHYHGH